MRLYFLEANVPLTKTFRKVGGDLHKSPYPNVTDVTSHEVVVADLKAFEAAMRNHAAQGHCLLKGQLSRTLSVESRAGTTQTDQATDWVLLDVDGLDNMSSVEDFMTAIGMKDVSYVLQWSASYGIETTALRCHIAVQLDKVLAAPLLKQWLIALNLDTPVLYAALKLTKTGNAISWPLDITTCQNDKLIYIAPPVLKGIKDPLAGKPRISYVKKTKQKLSIDVASISIAKNTHRMRNVLNELRIAQGLPSKKVAYKTVGATEVMVKPDACIITDRKQERDFIYFNLNGGDSWGYFHPVTNPDVIYNFKGEPHYLTKELLPDYWAELHQQGKPNLKATANIIDSTGMMKLAFLDPATDKYWRGGYDTKQDLLSIEATSSLTALRHFAKANGIIFQDDIVPEWNLVFDPHGSMRVDVVSNTVNTFQPTEYMRATPKQVAMCPKTIKKVIWHALGEDQEVYDRYMNWLAYVLQNRDVAITAWILHGVPGTGKGTWLKHVLMPLFGAQHVAVPRMSELEKEFNGFIDKSLLVVVDEFEAAALQSEKGVMADIKRYITEQHIQLRKMHRDARKIRNYTAWHFYSNALAPVTVPRDDRRFNVGKFQKNKLVLTPQERDRIESHVEMQAFHDFLLGYQVNKDLVFEPLMNQDRDDLIDLGESTIDTVVNALLGGNMAHFIDALPTDNRYTGNRLEANRIDDYKSVIAELLARTDRNTGACNIARDELKAIFIYLVGKTIPDSPNKFTSLLKHHRMRMTKVWIGGGTVNGAQLVWQDTQSWTQYLKSVAPPQLTPVAVKKTPKLVKVK